MAKKPVSLTIDESNLVWLQGLAARSGARSVSETVDRLITAAREGGASARAYARSVVGTIDISIADPVLEGADNALRTEFERSLTRPFVVKERRTAFRSKRATRRG